MNSKAPPTARTLHAWWLLAGFALLALSPSASHGASGEPEPTADEWFSTFYRQPRPKLLPVMLARLDDAGALEREGARAPISAFLSVVFRRPDVQAEAVVGAAKVGPEGRAVLLDALWLSGRGGAAARLAKAAGLDAGRYQGAPPDLAKMELREPAALDMMWGAFLASGDVAWPRRIIDLLDTPEPLRAPSPEWALLAGAARWSLASNARQHERVAALVRAEAERRTGPSKEVLDELVRELGPPVPSPARGAGMTRVVFRDVGPTVPREGFPSLPKTLYRSGDRFGRLEEQPDPSQGLHVLIVVAEPHVWQVNLVDRTGRHLVDPGPTLVFRAPIIPGEAGRPSPPMLEIGKEPEFMADHRAARRPGSIGGEPAELLEATVEGYRITVWLRKATGIPCRTRIERDGTVVAELEYLDYRRDLPARPELFAPPTGLRLEDGS